MTPNRPYFVGSLTSGVDGASEGGRRSTGRLPSTLVLYGVPLLKSIKKTGYAGPLTVEPSLSDGQWVLKVTYEGDEPSGVPRLWHGHHVLLQAKPPSDG